MQNTFSKRKRNTRSVWIITYSCILAIAFIGSIICYGVVNSSVKSQMNERNEIVLANIVTDIEEQLKEIDDTVLTVAIDKKVQNIAANVNLPLTSADRVQIFEMVDNLKYVGTKEDTNGQPPTVMIYVPRIGLIMKHSTCHSVEKFYSTYMSEDNITLIKWKQMINGKYPKGQYIITNFYGSKNELLYFKTIECINDKAKTFNVIFRIDKEKISANMKNLSQSDYGIFAVRDINRKNLIVSTPLKNTFGGKITVNKALERNDVCVFKKISQSNGWEYLYILPKKMPLRVPIMQR